MSKSRVLASIAIGVLGLSSGAVGQGGTLYGVELGSNVLATIDPATAAAAVVGPLGGGSPMTGLAADGATQTIWGLSPGTGGIYTINPTTGAATLVSSGLFTQNANGLAFDPGTGASGRLFVAQLNDNSLYSYDIATGVPTFLSTISGATDIEGLAFDTSTGTLYGLSDGATEGVYKIDPGSGQTSLLATMTQTGLWRGLDIDPDTGTLYATRVNPPLLTTISVSSGVVTNVGAITGIGVFVQGCAWMPDAGCYPDCNNSGNLTVADFGCFQGRYVLGDMYADCNASGTLTVADFGCFQGKYVIGCP